MVHQRSSLSAPWLSVDPKDTYQKGYLALQQHNKGSVVEYKDLMMRQLPAKKK